MGNTSIYAAAIAVLTIGIAAPAQADAVEQPLTIKSVGDMVVDRVHQRVFISDPDGGKVIATDYSGNQVGEAAVGDADHLALAPDSSRLYAASLSGSAIFALDTGTLEQTAKYATGDVEPYDVAVAGGRIWFSYLGNLGTIDPSTETPTVLLDRYSTPRGAAELATAEDRPDRIGLATRDETAVIDVSGDTATEVAAQDRSGQVVDVAMSPDGERIATIYNADSGIDLRDVSDLATSKLLQFPYYANRAAAVDFSTDGTIVGGAEVAVEPNLFVFAPSGEMIKEIEPPNRGRGLTRAVAWEPKSDRLFAVSANGTAFKFNTYTDAKVSPTTLTLSGAPTVVPGAPVTLTGKLTSSLSLPGGRSVEVTRDGTSLVAAEVGADGTFSITDTPPGEGTATYRVSYAGDASHLSSTATASVQVAKAVTGLAVWSAPASVVPGGPIAVVGRLTSWPGLPAPVVLSVSRDGTSLGTVPVDANSDWTFADTAPATEGTLNYEFSYPGDATHLPISRTTSVQVSRTASTLTLAGPTSATRAKALTLTGTLASPLGLPTGSTVSITRVDLESPAGKVLGSATVAGNGTFSWTDTPPAGGPVTYRAAFAGDATRTPASAAVSVAVSRTTPTLSINNNRKVYAYGQTVTFTASIGATYKNRTVEIWADPAGADQARRLVKRGTVNSAGKISVSFRLTRNTAMSAVFAGDARTAPRTITANVSTKVSLTLRMANYYKTAKISGTTYRYFKSKKNAYFSTSMTNGTNRKVYLEVERYYKGKWRTYDNGYFDADDQFYLGGSGLVGVRLRVRAEYVYGDSGDRLNATTTTAYQYFTFTK